MFDQISENRLQLINIQALGFMPVFKNQDFM